MGPRLKLPPYVHGFIDRHGKARFYFRRLGYKRTPLPGLPWSPDFMEKYEAALAGAAPIVIGIRRSRPGTVDDAVARYLGSVAFAGLAPTTRSKRRAVLERFRVEHGDKRIGKLRPDHVGNLLRKLRPYPQRNVFKALRALLRAIRWAHRRRPDNRRQVGPHQRYRRIQDLVRASAIGFATSAVLPGCRPT